MIAFTLFFTLGICCLQLLSTLPTRLWVIVLISSTIMLYAALRKRCPYLIVLFAWTLGFSWAYWRADQLLSWQLPHEQEGKPIQVIGRVISLPTTDQWQTSFLFQVDKPCHVRIRLGWQEKDRLIKVGDEWQFLVRLKRIHAVQNPGGHDYEAWALQNGIRASGSIITSPDNKLLAHYVWSAPIDQWRQALQAQILKQLPSHSATAPWLMALMIGERQGIPPESWDVLRNTGTNHLMAIAGLHIGMMSTLMFVLVSWLWRRFPRLVLMLPAQQAGACVALLTALLYSAMAGFSLPTQRACVMLCVYMLSILLKRRLPAWHAWSLALLSVLLINPLSMLTNSFWLSFATIALIIYGMGGRLHANSFWSKHTRPQWVIGIGLLPLSLLFFQEASLVSLAANTIAIPWLGFLILPLCFISGIIISVFPTIASYLLALADKNLTCLWSVLTWFSHSHLATWQQAIPNPGIFILTLCGCLLLLLPAGVAGRYLGLIWMLPLLLYQPTTPALGEYWLSLLDVGQGLAVVVQTHAHVLVFDAGPKFNPESDMGENVVAPYLNTRYVKKVDMLVISHGDNDHIGGAQSLSKHFPIVAIRTSVPDKLPSAVTQLCLRGEHWQWDKVSFGFIYPTKDNLNLNNDSSCVLRVDNGAHAVLLPGDIEKYAEKQILSQDQALLAATILIAPHHGSKSSGIAKFIAATHPQYVLYGVGYRNRYHFPNRSVVASYEALQALQNDTAKGGEIEMKIGHGIQGPRLYRVIHRHYWSDV